MKTVRNYNELIDRIQNISNKKKIVLENLAVISANDLKYPILKISSQRAKTTKRKALISAGIHGDEPAGVEAALLFIEKHYFQAFEDEWDLTFLPCLNPWGYENNTRNNFESKDLNRCFKSMDAPLEVQIAKLVLNEKYDLNMELHEDSDGSGYYLYLKGANDSFLSLGRKILTSVASIMPIDSHMEIEGIPVDNGMIHRLPDVETMDWWPMSVYAIIKNASCSLTLETSPEFPLEVRTQAHIKALQTTLKHFKDYLD